ncbi:hypothetical protein MML48_5g00008305 [Holotrichia oblita]|uniref:Uncharacterized protein n=1 Tax=Holotrichia oblita TaxID=644536 RepID=A0ACB9T1G4_HOLOL|nr:hypothetical protein MML48_5g00008305 [Holotrichia oblita]
MAKYSGTRKARHGVTTEKRRDLFAVPSSYALAHCVAQNLRMSRGIAAEFRKRYGRVRELLQQQPRIGETLKLSINGQSIFYLVTKKFPYQKPAYRVIWEALLDLRNHVLQQDILKLAIPKLGCGLNQLNWKILCYVGFCGRLSVRTYERTPRARTYRDYLEEAMREAIEAVKAGMSKKLAAATFGVERTTLGRRIVGTHPKAVGRPTVLTAQEEALIARTLGVVANWGFPLTKVDIRNVIKKFFNNNCPGPDFLDSFIKRNNLSVRMASNIKRSGSSVDHNDILDFINNIDLAIKEVKSTNFYNYDETNVTDDPGSRKVVVPRNTKRVERVQEHSRATISLMVCENASGDLLPPMVVYKALNLYDNWTQRGLQGTKYARTCSKCGFSSFSCLTSNPPERMTWQATFHQK